MDYEEKYEDLLYEYKKLKRDYEKLQDKLRVLDSELDSVKFLIKTELEPRIRRERRAYDNWVTNPER